MHLCPFWSPAIQNTNFAAVRTFGVGVSLAPLNVQFDILCSRANKFSKMIQLLSSVLFCRNKKQYGIRTKGKLIFSSLFDSKPETFLCVNNYEHDTKQILELYVTNLTQFRIYTSEKLRK
jgi:hypothetical protein